MQRVLMLFVTLIICCFASSGREVEGVAFEPESIDIVVPDSLLVDTYVFPALYKPDIFDFPYSRTRSMPNRKRLWVNTAILMGAGVTTMCVLEALPSESTAWNRHANTTIPLFRRWVNHVKAGPVWDGDNAIFNYVLHPYAGAAYYMGARGLGFNCLGSFLYSFCISTFFWEYGFEAFNEIPSVQDLIITPVVGSLLGEAFYLVKRHIVRNNYSLWGSKVVGYIVAFLVDPINEVVGYFYGDQRRHRYSPDRGLRVASQPWINNTGTGPCAGITARIYI